MAGKRTKQFYRQRPEGQAGSHCCHVRHVHVNLQGELEHRCVKRFYLRVSKAQFTAGIAKQRHKGFCSEWLSTTFQDQQKSRKWSQPTCQRVP